MAFPATNASGIIQQFETVTNPVEGTVSSNVNTEGKKATYSASIFGLVCAASAFDLLTIDPSPSKTVRVTRISISGSGTAKTLDVVVAKSTSPSTGGTPATASNIPHDSNDAAGTAVVKTYTASATTVVGGLGNLRSVKMTVQAADSAFAPQPIVWDFTTRNSKGLMLKAGSTQQIRVGFNAATTVTNPLFNIDVEWTEE